MCGILNGASCLLPGSGSAAGFRGGRAGLRSHPAFVVGLNQAGTDGGAADQPLWAPAWPSHPITAVGSVFLRRTPADVTDVVL